MAVHTKGTGLMPRVEETDDDDDVRGAIEIEDDDANRLQNAEIEIGRTKIQE